MATIYIVEDDVNIREIERYALKNSGYQVEEFECGADLFKRLESKVPALILLDIMLPNEDGLDILTKIRADKNTAKVPIIMVTAKTSEITLTPIKDNNKRGKNKLIKVKNRVTNAKKQ